MRKAINSSNNDESMGKQALEHYFTAIQEHFDDLEQNFESRFNNLEQKFELRMDKMEKTLKLVLDIVSNNDKERKEIKSTLWEHDRRLLNLEKQLT